MKNNTVARNKDKVYMGIGKISPLIKKFMIETLELFLEKPKSILNRVPPKDYEIKNAINKLKNAKEIKDLAGFFVYDERESKEGKVFKYCLAARKGYDLNTIQKCNEFQRKIEDLHFARNLSAHTDKEMEEDFPEDLTINYGSTLVVVSHSINDPLIETQIRLDQYFISLFGIHGKNIDLDVIEKEYKLLEEKYEWLKESKEAHEMTIKTLNDNLDTMKSFIKTLTDEIDYQKQLIEQLKSKIPEYSDDENYLNHLFQMSEKGDCDAQINLSLRYATGTFGVKQNFEKAFLLMKDAANGGNKFAIAMVAHDYYYGFGTEKSTKKAIDWIKKADPVMIDIVEGAVYTYYSDEGMIHTYSESFEWFSALAEKGNLNAYYNLGLMYLNGDYVNKDYIKSKYFLEKAAKLGDGYSYYLIGTIYHSGGYGVERSYETAKQYYKLSSENGCPIGEYIFFENENGCILLGDATEDSAKKWKSFADSGNMWAQYAYGEYLYWDGGDPDEGLHYYYLAAEQGHVEAQADYGRNGPCSEESFLFLKEAAEANELASEKAFYPLAIYYKDGIYTEKSIPNAIKWFVKSIHTEENLCFDSDSARESLKEMLIDEGIYNDEEYEEMCNNPNYKYKEK